MRNPIYSSFKSLSYCIWAKLNDIDDVMDENDIKKLPISERCAEILCPAVSNRTFEGITEEDAGIVVKEFVEPVAYGDINLLKLDSYYGEVQNCCIKLWRDLPLDMKNKIYGN